MKGLISEVVEIADAINESDACRVKVEEMATRVKVEVDVLGNPLFTPSTILEDAVVFPKKVKTLKALRDFLASVKNAVPVVEELRDELDEDLYFNLTSSTSRAVLPESPDGCSGFLPKAYLSVRFRDDVPKIKKLINPSFAEKYYPDVVEERERLTSEKARMVGEPVVEVTFPLTYQTLPRFGEVVEELLDDLKNAKSTKVVQLRIYKRELSNRIREYNKLAKKVNREYLASIKRNLLLGNFEDVPTRILKKYLKKVAGLDDGDMITIVDTNNELGAAVALELYRVVVGTSVYGYDSYDWKVVSVHLFYVASDGRVVHHEITPDTEDVWLASQKYTVEKVFSELLGVDMAELKLKPTRPQR